MSSTKKETYEVEGTMHACLHYLSTTQSGNARWLHGVLTDTGYIVTLADAPNVVCQAVAARNANHKRVRVQYRMLRNQRTIVNVEDMES